MKSQSASLRHTKIILNILTVVLIAYFFSANYMESPALCKMETHVAQLGSASFVLHVRDTPEGRSQGLSGRPSLPANEGEYFVFDAPIEAGFWMKDMLFPIDIIFLDSEHRVAGLVRDARPESYPKLFMSPPVTRYAIEVQSGIIDAKGIQLGDQAKIASCDER